MKYHKIIIYLLLISNFAFSQSLDRFGRQQETALDFGSIEQKKEMMEQSQKMQFSQSDNMVVIPLEKAIDSETYVVGPGDQFGININTLENLNFIAVVGPMGDILIPTVGIIDVNGKTLKDAISCMKKFINSNGYKTADVYVTLMSVRYFKVQISGAVNEPGFYMATPLTRLGEIIEMAMGFHPSAKEDSIRIRRNNNATNSVDFTDYLITGDIGNNPCFTEGDKIYIPFKNKIVSNISSEKIIEIYTEKGVSVNGYVQIPGSYRYFSGYTVADYVGLAGGNSKEGNPNKAYVKHADGTIEKGMEITIQRGDQIIVPRSLAQWLVGNSSIGQLIISAASVYMSYLAATK